MIWFYRIIPEGFLDDSMIGLDFTLTKTLVMVQGPALAIIKQERLDEDELAIAS